LAYLLNGDRFVVAASPPAGYSLSISKSTRHALRILLDISLEGSFPVAANPKKGI